MLVKLREFFRTAYNFFNRIRLKNTDVTLIASNCNGCCILHDLGLKFNSPFVNLWVEPSDFIRRERGVDSQTLASFRSALVGACLPQTLLGTRAISWNL